MRKWFLIALILILLFSGLNFVFAQKKIEINFFYSATCPHCAKEKVFLEELEEKYPQIEVKKLGLFERKNVELLKGFYRDYKVPSEIQGYVPITFIEERYFFGFSEEIGNDIENYILELIGGMHALFEPEDQVEIETPTEEIATILEEKIRLPILGEIDVSKFSLPIIAVILGFFDGFNVCSLGSLVLILGLVLALRSKVKTLILGGVFILITGIVYGILIFLWHKIFVVFSPYLRKMEIAIGILAILGSIYFLKEFLKFRKGKPVCEFGGISEKLSTRVQRVFKERKGVLALILAVSFFAATVTAIEFPCSAVLPVLFAGILTEAHLSFLSALLYISIFIIFYLLDEIIVFLISVFTMKLWITSPKFMLFLNLTASLILFCLGTYYLIGLV